MPPEGSSVDHARWDAGLEESLTRKREQRARRTITLMVIGAAFFAGGATFSNMTEDKTHPVTGLGIGAGVVCWMAGVGCMIRGKAPACPDCGRRMLMVKRPLSSATEEVIYHCANCRTKASDGYQEP